MALSEALLPEFHFETAATRRTLERVDEKHFAWKPHEKSMSFGALAGHLAEIPGWVTATIKQDSLDLAPKDGPAYQSPRAESRAQLLEVFDKNVIAARVAIESASDELLHKPWSLLAGGNVIFTMPRFAVLRSFILNHMIHHRAQLGVYLRMNNIPVPSVYGPSADEKN